MVTFWSRLCSFPPRWSILVPRHARLQPPPPHSVHRSRIRCRLVPCNGPRCPPCWAGESEETSRPPGGVVDQAGATLYGLPPALAVQGLHIGFGHHHFGAGGTHTRLVLHVNRSAEESTSKEKAPTTFSGHVKHLNARYSGINTYYSPTNSFMYSAISG